MAEESLTWAIWSTGATAVFSVSIAYYMGNYIMNPIVMAALGFLIPYFSFTALPFLIILFVAFTGSTIVS
jgi:hypothetical protein